MVTEKRAASSREQDAAGDSGTLAHAHARYPHHLEALAQPPFGQRIGPATGADG